MISLAHLVRIPRLPGLVLLLLCGLLFLPGLGRTPVTREQELRVLLTAREMAEGGDWIVPRYLGEERLRKPPLMYWLVASAYRVIGSSASEGAARAVSAGAATLLVLATFLCGRHLLGRESAFLGAIVLATSIGYLRHARLAETDVPQMLCAACAIFAGFTALTVTRPWRWWLALGVCAGVGFLFKGPASIAMPLAALLTYALVSRRRAYFFEAGPAATALGVAAAVLVCLAIAAPWYIAVYERAAGQAGDEMNRLLGESTHPGPFYYYLYTLPARLGLWAPLLPLAVWVAAPRLRAHRGFRLVLCWLASSFVVLSAIESKQSHYALLLFVPSALLIGWLLHRAFASPRARLARLTRAWLALICGLPAAALLGWGISFLLRVPEHYAALRMALLPTLFVAAMLGVVGWLGRRTPLAPMACIALALAVGQASHALSFGRLLDGAGAIPELVVSRSELIRHAPRVHFAGAGYSAATWYAQRPLLSTTGDVRAVWASLSENDLLLVISRGRRTVDVTRLQSAPLSSVSRHDTTVQLFRKGAPGL